MSWAVFTFRRNAIMSSIFCAYIINCVRKIVDRWEWNWDTNITHPLALAHGYCTRYFILIPIDSIKSICENGSNEVRLNGSITEIDKKKKRKVVCVPSKFLDLLPKHSTITQLFIIFVRIELLATSLHWISCSEYCLLFCDDEHWINDNILEFWLMKILCFATDCVVN